MLFSEKKFRNILSRLDQSNSYHMSDADLVCKEWTVLSECTVHTCIHIYTSTLINLFKINQYMNKILISIID